MSIFTLIGSFDCKTTPLLLIIDLRLIDHCVSIDGTVVSLDHLCCGTSTTSSEDIISNNYEIKYCFSFILDEKYLLRITLKLRVRCRPNDWLIHHKSQQSLETMVFLMTISCDDFRKNCLKIAKLVNRYQWKNRLQEVQPEGKEERLIRKYFYVILLFLNATIFEVRKRNLKDSIFNREINESKTNQIWIQNRLTIKR